MSNYFASNVIAENYDMYFSKYNSAEGDKPLIACSIETFLNEVKLLFSKVKLLFD